ncbi:hypothetical protein [Cryptosporangium sp. NPDC048952]|uniref:hypothetical protein n=1 Tax=Cryptosporangium sp. NPDC048952 TaxID=3363961 RepID=UPI00371DDD4F
MQLRRGVLRAAAAGLITLLATSAGAVLGPSTAHADLLYCGSSKYIEKIEVANWGNGRFQILVTPNSAARIRAGQTSTDPIRSREVVVDEWHAVQACVRGLYGSLADSIWQQLDCHQRMSWVWHPLRRDWLTGPTYDLESWRPALTGPNVAVQEARTRCLNTLGVDENSKVTSPYRPDAGQFDLLHAWGNFA